MRPNGLATAAAGGREESLILMRGKFDPTQVIGEASRLRYTWFGWRGGTVRTWLVPLAAKGPPLVHGDAGEQDQDAQDNQSARAQRAGGKHPNGHCWHHERHGWILIAGPRAPHVGGCSSMFPASFGNIKCRRSQPVFAGLRCACINPTCGHISKRAGRRKLDLGIWWGTKNSQTRGRQRPAKWSTPRRITARCAGRGGRVRQGCGRRAFAWRVRDAV